MYWHNTVTVSSSRHDLFLSKTQMERGGKAIAGFYWNNGYMVSWTDLKECKLPPISPVETDESKVKHEIIVSLMDFVVEQCKYYNNLYNYLIIEM